MTATVTRPALCSDVRPVLASYTLGRLPLPRTQQIYAHLMDCGPCWEEADKRLSPRAIEKEKPKTLLFTLPTAALAALVFSSAVIFGAAPKVRAIPPARPAAAHPLQTMQKTASPFQAGKTYYLRLTAADAAVVGKAQKEAAVKELRGPYAGRYYLTGTPAQLAAFTQRLEKTGELETAMTGNRRWRDEARFDQGDCSATLDLVS